jgi:hypothetical protein
MAAIEKQPALTDPEPESSLSPMVDRIFASIHHSVPELPQKDPYFKPETYRPENTDLKAEAETNAIPVEPEEIARDGLFRQLRNFKDKLIYLPINLRVRGMAGDEENSPVVQPEAPAAATAERTPRRITARRVGQAALALAITGGIAYLAVKGMPHGARPTLGSQEFLAPVQHTRDHTKAASEALPRVSAPAKAGHEHTQRIAHHIAKSAAKTKEYKETLKHYGDNIWSHVQNRVQAKFGNLSEHRRTQLIIKFTQQALKLNPKIDSNNMSVGESFQLPAQLR